jgi:hypothetical protein
MTTWTHRAVSTLSVFSFTLSLAAPAWAQEKVGVVTTVVGPVSVARTSMAPAALKFKDDVFVNDRVTTGDEAMTRILLGGKVIVTARERSTLTITEVPGLATIDLGTGRIAVAVDRTRMKPGERVDVRTPHAVAGVRGTVLVVEAKANTSTVTVLKGLVEVARLDASGRPVGAITPVAAQQAVSVRNNVLPARPQAITPGRSQELSKEFTPPLKPVVSTRVVPENELVRVAELLNAALPARGPGADEALGMKDGTKDRDALASTAGALSSRALPVRANVQSLGTSPVKAYKRTHNP